MTSRHIFTLSPLATIRSKIKKKSYTSVPALRYQFGHTLKSCFGHGHYCLQGEGNIIVYRNTLVRKQMEKSHFSIQTHQYPL